MTQNEVQTTLRNASLVLAWPDGDERRAEAERQVRMAMYRAALGQISEEVKGRILGILFPLCPDLFVSHIPAAKPEWGSLERLG